MSVESARIGLIVPSSNPTIEAFLPRVAGLLDSRFLVTRIGVRRIASDADAAAQFDREGLFAAAELLRDAEVSVVSWAGTAGFWMGGDDEDALLAEGSARLGVRMISSRVAMLAALEEFRGCAIGLLTPYVDEVHLAVRSTLENQGYEVVADAAFGIERNLDFAGIPASSIHEKLSQLSAAGAEVIPLVCTNVLGTLPGPPGSAVVVDSVLATLWHAAREAGRTSLGYLDCSRAVLDGISLNEQEQL